MHITSPTPEEVWDRCPFMRQNLNDRWLVPLWTACLQVPDELRLLVPSILPRLSGLDQLHRLDGSLACRCHRLRQVRLPLGLAPKASKVSIETLCLLYLLQRVGHRPAVSRHLVQFRRRQPTGSILMLIQHPHQRSPNDKETLIWP